MPQQAVQVIVEGLKYAVLGSGSSANSYIFEYRDTSFFVDNGFSCKAAMDRAVSLGFDLSKVQCIFLTHDHHDHFKGVELLSRKVHAPVVTHNQLNLRRKVKKNLYKQIGIEPGRRFSRDDFSFQAFPTSHDAEHSVSYHFRLGPAAFTLITDTGSVSQEMYDLAAASDVLFLEANYDETMLKEGPYHPVLKDRILSHRGHLSNSDAVSFLNRLGEDPASRLREVYFCHLSSTNNSPEVLERYIGEHLTWRGEWVVCPKGETVDCSLYSLK